MQSTFDFQEKLNNEDRPVSNLVKGDIERNRQNSSSKNNKAESKKLLNEIINDEDGNQEIKLEAQKKLTRDFSE